MLIQNKSLKISKQLTYKLLKQLTVHLQVFSWRTTHPVALKGIMKVPNQKIARRPICLSFSSSSSSSSSFFFFRQASSNLCDSQWFAHKTAAFSTEQCTSPSLVSSLKSHKVVWTAHWRTMASFATPFFFMCTHAHKSLSKLMKCIIA